VQTSVSINHTLMNFR